MIEIFIAFLAGALTGYWARPKDPELKEQKALYDKKLRECDRDIRYYKELCQWHVEQRRTNDQKKT